MNATLNDEERAYVRYYLLTVLAELEGDLLALARDLDGRARLFMAISTHKQLLRGYPDVFDLRLIEDAAKLLQRGLEMLLREWPFSERNAAAAVERLKTAIEKLRTPGFYTLPKPEPEPEPPPVRYRPRRPRERTLH